MRQTIRLGGNIETLVPEHQVKFNGEKSAPRCLIPTRSSTTQVSRYGGVDNLDHHPSLERGGLIIGFARRHPPSGRTP
jgi:hypothetical protein